MKPSCAVALETDQRAPDESAGRGSQVISDEVRPPREIWRRVTPSDPSGARGISILWPSSVPTTGVPGGRCTLMSNFIPWCFRCPFVTCHGKRGPQKWNLLPRYILLNNKCVTYADIGPRKLLPSANEARTYKLFYVVFKGIDVIC